MSKSLAGRGTPTGRLIRGNATEGSDGSRCVNSAKRNSWRATMRRVAPLFAFSGVPTNAASISTVMSFGDSARLAMRFAMLMYVRTVSGERCAACNHTTHAASSSVQSFPLIIEPPCC